MKKSKITYTVSQTKVTAFCDIKFEYYSMTFHGYGDTEELAKEDLLSKVKSVYSNIGHFLEEN